MYVIDVYSDKVTHGQVSSALTVHDLKSGNSIAEITLPLVRTSYISLPNPSELLLSADGSRLYLSLMDISQGTRILALDTETLQVVGDVTTPKLCAGAWVPKEQNRVIVRCAGEFTSVDFDASRLELIPLELSANTISANALAVGSAYIASQETLYTLSEVTVSGELTLTLKSASQNVPPTSIKLDKPAEARVSYQAPWVISPDGKRVYVRFRSSNGLKLPDSILFGHDSYADQIGIFDPMTGNRISLIRLKNPVLTIALSVDGQTLYGINPQKRSITVIDTTTAKVVDTLENVGQTPVLLVAGP